MLTIFLLILLLIITYFLFNNTKNNPKLPPGPKAYPIIGNLLSLITSNETRPEIIFKKLSDKYGELVSLNIGTKSIVLLKGYDVIKTILLKPESSYRPEILQMVKRSYDKKLGVIFSDGNFWKVQRRFTIRHLREFGFGKLSAMDELINREIKRLFETIEYTMKIDNTNEINLEELFPASVINILWDIVAGINFKHNDPKFEILKKCVKDFMLAGKMGADLSSFFPFLRFIPGLNNNYNLLLKVSKELQDFIQESIEQHKKTFDANNLRDFIDVYLNEMQSENADPTFTDEQLNTTCVDLFLGGTDTTSTTLSAMFLYLIKYPEIQNKLHDEIKLVIGKDRPPTLEDLPKMNYVQAFTHEILRHGSLIPLTAPHKTSEDITYNGFIIPKDTMLIINLYSIHHDSNYWKNPEQFNPERFIDSNGNFIKDEKLIIFGLGPRICLGETLARKSIFLFLTSILQKYKCEALIDADHVALDFTSGLTNAPAPYKLRLIPNTF